MRNSLKKILYILPRPVRTGIVLVRECWWFIVMSAWEKVNYPNLQKIKIKKKNGPIKNILIYHINGLTYAGTEKNLQLIANGLSDKYNIFYMYGEKTAEESRKESLNSHISLIPFSYESNEIAVPHKLNGMRPHIKEVIVDHDIDLIITASPGYAHYPWNIITDIPIVLLNIFGAPVIQSNIKKIIYISNEIRKHAERWTGHQESATVAYCPINNPSLDIDSGNKLRERLGIPKKAFVLGRIGRADDAIFDPIGIEAFSLALKNHPELHYIVMSPPPILEKIVAERNISNVHFLAPSGSEADVWAFHYALDVFAHFRADGETSGVAIAESLSAGNPIITHRSRVWNAHLEYLKENCARIADIDSVEEYANYIEEFIDLKANHPTSWKKIQEQATLVGFNNFSPDAYLEKIHTILQKI